MMLNLFILVLLQQFEEYHISSDNPLTQFRDYVEQFRTSWAECTFKHKGAKIHKSNLLFFFQKLEPPLGNLLINILMFLILLYQDLKVKKMLNLLLK